MVHNSDLSHYYGLNTNISIYNVLIYTINKYIQNKLNRYNVLFLSVLQLNSPILLAEFVMKTHVISSIVAFSFLFIFVIAKPFSISSNTVDLRWVLVILKI